MNKSIKKSSGGSVRVSNESFRNGTSTTNTNRVSNESFNKQQGNGKSTSVMNHGKSAHAKQKGQGRS